jgi:hypothetical protein
MSPRRSIPVDIIPGKSITRFHLAVENSMLPDSSTELHISHYPDGDFNEPAQWYNIYEHPTEWDLNLAREALNIDEEDWMILEHMLGSFHWVMFTHPTPPQRSEIRVDVPAMKAGEWTTTYF